MKYNLYIQQHVRKMIQYKDVSYTQALAWLSEEYALVKDMDGNKYYTKEELINAKNKRSDDRAGFDITSGSSRSFFEDTNRELPGSSGDNTE